MKKASDDETLTEFSYEAIKDKLSKGCQLWAVRLPQNVRLSPDYPRRTAVS